MMYLFPRDLVTLLRDESISVYVFTKSTRRAHNAAIGKTPEDPSKTARPTDGEQPSAAIYSPAGRAVKLGAVWRGVRLRRRPGAGGARAGDNSINRRRTERLYNSRHLLTGTHSKQPVTADVFGPCENFNTSAKRRADGQSHPFSEQLALDPV